MRRGPRHVVVVGDALLDRDLHGSVNRIAPDAPVPVVADPREGIRPGGAGLAAALAARDEVQVTLVAAVGDDEAGRRLTAALMDLGVAVTSLASVDPTAEKIRIHARGQVLLRVDRGGAHTRPSAWNDAAHEALASADAVLVSDYGRGMTAHASVRRALDETVRRHVPIIWDPHPRGTEPVAGVQLVTPNRSEAAGFCPPDLAPQHARGGALSQTRAQAAYLADRWSAAGVCITLGAEGALLVSAEGTPLAVPAPKCHNDGLDTCGAGDRFASAAAVAIARGLLPSDAVVHAVADATQFVEAGAAGRMMQTQTGDGRKSYGPGVTGQGIAGQEAPSQGVNGQGVNGQGATGNGATGQGVYGEAATMDLVARTRACGGTIVATGGCFDLLHAGHVRMLETARQLGDMLIVCLNTDASVRHLKGPGRPLTSQDDRAAVLAGLTCVDAVVVFDEDTPEALLDRLRPDIWAKGGDYMLSDLPEAALMTSWGGQAVVLPYLTGRSTTSILQEARRDH